MNHSFLVFDHFYFRVIIFVILILIVLSEAIKEGLYMTNKKTISKQVKIIEKSLWWFSIWLMPHEPIQLMWLILAYILLRFALFDFSFNISARLPILYSGTTTWFYDQVMKGMKDKYPSIYFMNCLIALLLAFSFIFNQLQL